MDSLVRRTTLAHIVQYNKNCVLPAMHHMLNVEDLRCQACGISLTSSNAAKSETTLRCRYLLGVTHPKL